MRRPQGRSVFLVGVGLALCLGQGTIADSPPATEAVEKAVAAWQDGYVLHSYGQYERAIEFYRKSISIHPTAEAHTFLGWSMSHLGRREEAIAECKKAIALDPEFGNPYNDIGAYLIELGKPREAIPWLESAMSAKRYCCHYFAHFNLGRVHLARGDIDRAKRAFERALEIEPNYLPAQHALELLERAGIRSL